MKNNYLVQAWLVLGLAVCFGAALAGMEMAVADKIKAAKLNETLKQIPSLVDGSVAGREDKLGDKIIYRAMDNEGNQVGWVIPAGGQGFADTIEILIGLDAKAENITGLYVLSQKETPGLGDKIYSDDEWRKQFSDKSALQDISAARSAPSGNEILAVTGATVSSQSVCKIMNKAIIDFRNAMVRGRIAPVAAGKKEAKNHE